MLKQQLKSALTAVLIVAMGLGSFPASVGAFQNSRVMAEARATASVSARPLEAGAKGEDAIGAEPSMSEAKETAEEPAPWGADEAAEGIDVLREGDTDGGTVLLADRAAVHELGGRDYVGQTVKEIGGKTYILIGNEQQLRAIGSNKPVIDKVFGSISHDVVHPGDADLAPGEDLQKKPISEVGHCGAGVDGSYDSQKAAQTGLEYAYDANYIIFRDIDLSGSPWQPLMFSGTMLGAKARDGAQAGNLWGSFDSTHPDGMATDAVRPVISNVDVHVSGKLDISKHQGIGFFGTISNKIDKNKLGVSAGEALVKNIALDRVTVVNESVESVEPTSLVEGLLHVVGGLLGVIGEILDILLNPLLPGLKLDTVLSSLLTSRSEDPTTFATGAFAGRIVGQARVEGCAVTGASVANAPAASVPAASPYAGITGGFVGYVSGEVEYDGLSKGLGITVKVLESLLNALPGIGLGDLVKVLLDANVITLDKLIPTGYNNAKIIDSALSLATGAPELGSPRAEGVGGFAGVQVGTIIDGCRIDSPVGVRAKTFAGGFTGVERNAQLIGSLDGLGANLLTQLGELIGRTKTQSLLLDCVLAQGATVAAEGQYAGGFAGVMANSYVVNGTAGAALDVSAGTSDAGGVAGAALLGWGTSVGETDKNSLLNSVSGLVGGLVGQEDVASSGLLSLTGIEPSVITGVRLAQVSSVRAGESCAGGVVGRGEGVRIGAMSADVLGEMAYWSGKEAARYPVTPVERPMGAVVSSVAAGADCAGGIAGALGPGNVAGLIKKTIGAGDIKMFWSRGVTIAGGDAGLVVHADGAYAGGAIGRASGGKVDETRIARLATVTAANHAGGFAGFAGPASTAAGDGLNLLNLNLIKISGLLSVAQYSALRISRSSVAGVADGYVVEATRVDGNAVAGGFFGQANSVNVADCHALGIRAIRAPKAGGRGVAGGFVGSSTTGGLVHAVSQETGTGGLLEGLLGGPLLKLDNLLGAVPYLIPKYWGVDAAFVNGGTVSAAVAGGFAGDFQSGKINQFGAGDAKALAEWVGSTDAAAIEAAAKKGPWAVVNIAEVDGGLYAGGFGGRVRSGSLASANEGGINLLGKLGLNAANLLGVVQAYVPYISYAGVRSNAMTGPDGASGSGGFTVRAKDVSDTDSRSGSAGGWVGWGSAMQVSHCAVDELRHTKVARPEDLEVQRAEGYYGPDSAYSVDAARTAGGWAGTIDIGSTAAAGSGLSALGKTIGLTDLLSTLNVMVSTVEHSDVHGAVGGLSVRASGTLQAASGKMEIGRAGGFAGAITGGHIQDSSVSEFDYVVGRESAGGYAGTMEPGDVAGVLGEGNAASIFKTLGLAQIDSLVSLVQDFVPTVHNSYTECVPCGGAVRAEAESSRSTQRGAAGGYVGVLDGGHIWGNDGRAWKDASIGATYDGDKHPAAARRIRSVFGTEFAGGYVGLMKPSDTASSGGLYLLGGLIQAGNLASVLSVVYPTTENSEVSGPLRGIRIETFQAWVEHVAKYGAYGKEFAGIVEALQNQGITTQGQLDQALADYLYGYNVVAGRSEYGAGSLEHAGGMAGGYAGLMRTGTVSNGQALDAKTVRAMRAAGGFAGGIEAGSAAAIGDVKLLGVVDLDLGSLLKTPEVFVPMVKSSSVQGYRSGMTVRATGTELEHGMGCAGGYAGYALGAQIWGDRALKGQTATGCNATNLRRVAGTASVGGYVGRASGGSVATADTEASSGLLQSLLDGLIGSPGKLATALNATVTTIRGAKASAAAETAGAEPAWGFTVDGFYREGGTTRYATAAGGFAGSIEASVLGAIDAAGDPTRQLEVQGLRSVEGGKYAGGFFGIGDVGSVASVGSTGADGQSGTTLLKLIQLGNTDVLDAFRTYIYHARVQGVADGVRIESHEQTSEGTGEEKRYTGTAGGFGGSLLNGSVKDCSVERLNAVKGPNYTGGFVGHLGKSGTVDVDKAQVGGSLSDLLKLLGANAGVLDIWGSHVERCRVDGIDAGYTVASSHGTPITSDAASERLDGQEMAAGFVGFADMAKIDGCHVTDLKKVTSGQVAGGFVGKTTMGFVAGADLGSNILLEPLLSIVNALLKILYADALQDLNAIKISIPGLPGLIDLGVFAEGKTLYVNLLGLRVGVALSRKQDSSDPGATDVAVITIGDSTISLQCGEQGLIGENDKLKSNLSIALIKGNRTNITNNSVTGVATGYDVFGGGATDTSNGFGIGRYEGGRGTLGGYAGGFVGLSNESVLDHNKMAYCDTVRGKGHDARNDKGGTITGPFTGMTYLKTVYEPLDDKRKIETKNFYSIYREANDQLTQALKGQAGGLFATMRQDDAEVGGGAFGLDMNRYDVAVREQVGISEFDELNGAVEQGAAGQRALEAYREDGAKAVLMRDTPQVDNGAGLTPEPGDGQDPCTGSVDLTLQKVWDDFGDRDGMRPDFVDFYITATYTDKDGGQVVQWVVPLPGGGYGLAGEKAAVRLTAADASPHSETWRRVLAGLPVAFEDASVSPAQIRYYTYRVQEVAVDGYSVVYGADRAGHVLTVKNVYRPPLPETGGAGTWFTVLAGGMLTAWAVYERRRRGDGGDGYVPRHLAAPAGAGGRRSR